jgi:hypothetical protein
MYPGVKVLKVEIAVDSDICTVSTSGVNFINVLRAAFICADPKRTKNTVKLSVFFVLLGSSCEKAAHRLLMKLTPDNKQTLP